MKTSIRTVSLVSVAAVALSTTAAFGFKEYCSWYVNFIEMDKGRSMAVTFFEHPEHPMAVKAYVDRLRKAGTMVVTQQELAKGVKIPPLEKGQSLVFVFEENPDVTIRAHFPSPSVDLHNVEINVRDEADIVNAVKANYTSAELANHPIDNPQVGTIIDAYIAHYDRLGVRRE
ncbi:MAG: hypothetical protein GY798_09480 [Hyphomicrobiales bacterium]|nr:hypothetical protein [Hyphomicrobiales bacterium]